jgi:hypothetical protein
MAALSKTVNDQLADAMEIIRQKNRELNEQKKTIQELRKEDDTAAKIREKIYGIAAYDPDPPTWLVREGSSGKRGTPSTMWSDWHYGEVVQEKQVGGVNKYNKVIARDRVKRLTNTTIDLCFNHMGRAATKYPGIVVCLGGDMIGGDIHEELAMTNDRTTQQAIEDLIDLIAAGLDTVAVKFGKVFVPCVVGNHGRSTHKMRMKNRVFTSHEWNVYCGVARYFKKSKHVQFKISEEADQPFNIYNHRYLLTHGDSLGVKGGDGIIGALGPIMRGTLKTHRSESQINREFDTLIMGHWHQQLWLPGAIVANSLKGYDEYARLQLRAPYSRPSQPLWFTHPEHGITARWEVYVEKALAQSGATDWVSWAD